MQPQSNSDDNKEQPFTEAYWAQQTPSDQLSKLAREANRAQLALIRACCPNGDADVEHHAAKISVRLGITRGEALRICDIGLMLRRMPRLAQRAESTDSLTPRQLGIIAHGTCTIADEQIHAVETEVLELVTPSRPRQAMIGPRSLTNKIGDIVAEYDDRARGDGTIPTIIKGESVQLMTLNGGKYSQIIATLRSDRALEIMSAIGSASRAREGMTQAQALVDLVSGNTSADVTLNIYREPGSDKAWLDGAGWLSALATQQWMTKVTHLCLSADSATDSYRPTEAQIARVRGRDGTCRFPGCEVLAHHCDVDHIQPFNLENPQDGGPTDTQNLHCLCRKHHNLKTHHLWEITSLRDATEVWSSVDGTVATTVPSGPMAGFGCQTFDQRATRRTKARQQHYIDWLMSFSVSDTEIIESTEADDSDSPESEAE